MKLIDLHVHSTASDGTMTPSEVTAYAAQKGLAAFALTDHDTVAGLEEAFRTAASLSIEVISGIEFSTVYHEQDIHIVGLDMDYTNPRFQEKLLFLQQERKRRNQKMIDRMAADGIDISNEKMMEEFGDTLWTRAHFARYLANHGYVKHMWDAFQTHIGDHCKYYVPRERVSPFQMVEFIREMDGIPILAHPFQYHLGEEGLTELIKLLKPCGLIGIEAIYSTHTGTQENEIRKLARHFGLCISGGSDFHGANKPAIDLGKGKGNLKIPYEILEQLRAARQQQKN